jgi:hypothetical protein
MQSLVIKRNGGYLIMSHSKERDEEFRLYKEFSGVCVDEIEYNNIMYSGIIPKELDEIFAGSYSVIKRSCFDNYNGELARKIASHEEQVFLHDASHQFSSLSNAYFFYKDFIVIVSVGAVCSNTEDRNGYVYQRSVARPVIVPMNKIKSVEYEKGRYGFTEEEYSIVIKFMNEKRIKIKMFHSRNTSYLTTKKTWVPSDNWTFEVNRELLNFSEEIYAGVDNCEKLIGRINRLMNQSTDYSEVDSALWNSFTEEGFFALKKVKYNEDMLINEAIRNKKNIKTEGLLDAVNRYEDVATKHEVKYRELKEKYEKALDEYNNASFLRKLTLSQKPGEYKLQLDKMVEARDSEITVAKEQIYGAIFDNSRKKVLSSVDEKAINFYKRCIEKNISDPYDPEQALIFNMLYMQEGIDSYENAVAVYRKGHSAFNEDGLCKNKQDSSKKRTLAIVNYSENKRIADLTGYDKYIKTAIEKAEAAKKQAQILDAVTRMGVLQSQTQATKSDASIWGGIADGLAGPVAGIATAANVQYENYKVEQTAARAREEGRTLASQASQMGMAYSAESMRFGSEVHSITRRMCDINNKYFEYLDCKVIAFENICEDVFSIKVEVASPPKVAINKIDFILDGSVKVNILAQDSVIGSAYICAPGYDNTNLNEVGFGIKKVYETIGVVENVFAMRDKGNLSFSIEPYHLWIIEK